VSLYPKHASLPLEQLPTPELEQPSPFLYGGPDDERYSATSPEEYLIELYDGDLDRETEDVEVCTYRRRDISEDRMEDWAESVFESFEQWFSEEYGGDDDSYRPGHREQALADARAELAPVLRRLAARHLVVWQCEEVSRRTYTAAEVREIIGCPSAPRPSQVPVPVHRYSEPTCDKPAPSSFPGQPFEWHLGHGCALDVSEDPS
jgi:hypothetical protein